MFRRPWSWLLEALLCLRPSTLRIVVLCDRLGRVPTSEPFELMCRRILSCAATIADRPGGPLRRPGRPRFPDEAFLSLFADLFPTPPPDLVVFIDASMTRSPSRSTLPGPPPRRAPAPPLVELRVVRAGPVGGAMVGRVSGLFCVLQFRV